MKCAIISDGTQISDRRYRQSTFLLSLVRATAGRSLDGGKSRPGRGSISLCSRTRLTRSPHGPVSNSLTRCADISSMWCLNPIGISSSKRAAASFCRFARNACSCSGGDLRFRSARRTSASLLLTPMAWQISSPELRLAARSAARAAAREAERMAAEALVVSVTARGSHGLEGSAACGLSPRLSRRGEITWLCRGD